MRRSGLSIFTVVFALTGSSVASAQWRCDCTTIVDSCVAEVAVRDAWIDVTTDSAQCARVDFFVDGLPFVATAVEGRDRQDWISPRPNPNVLVQSCQVCADNATQASPAPSVSAPLADDSDAFEPLLRWSPEYPAQAETQGIEGHVTIEFDVTAEGSVENLSVVESQPAGLFDDAALDAVRRWRYPSAPDRDAIHISERLEFSIDDMLWQLRPSDNGPSPDLLGRTPRNQCIREDAEFNYGDMIESGLINTCSDPLVVYGCAEGIGRQLGRWVCSDIARSGGLLVPPGDTRVGMTSQIGERVDQIEWLTYTDSFFIARAPNSQYWWVACAQGDTQCRDDARMWIRSVDRQPASVDPSRRSGIAVARSF